MSKKFANGDSAQRISHGALAGAPYALTARAADDPQTGHWKLDLARSKCVGAQTVERIVYLGGKPVSTERWVISKDGKTRIATQSGIDAQGKPINNLQIYVKQ